MRDQGGQERSDSSFVDLFVALGIEPRASCMLAKCSLTELLHQPPTKMAFKMRQIVCRVSDLLSCGGSLKCGFWKPVLYYKVGVGIKTIPEQQRSGLRGAEMGPR